MPKAFPKEFRDDVVAVAGKGEAPISQIAKDFGISESCLHRWLQQADVENGVRPGVSSAESAELRELKKRNRLLEQENEILRRAAVNSTGQRNTIDNFGGGVAWSRLGVQGCRRIGGRRYGSGGKLATRSVRSRVWWGPRRDRSFRSCFRSAGSISLHSGAVLAR